MKIKRFAKIHEDCKQLLTSLPQLAQTANIDSSETRLVNELQNQVANHDRELTSHSSTATPAVTEAFKARESLLKIITPKANPELQRCPVARQPPDPEDLEMDFTTPGVQGSLECPFAKMQHKLPTAPNSIDPIAAEFHQEHVSVQTSDGAPNASKCPIRFLDQHSPEEVAKYFENHKHEIPRSHEICVKRYQQNEHSIRELDAKYGNLVNMIQGLGVKHKQYLPQKEAGDDEDTDDEVEDKTSTQAVEKWAENVSQPAGAEPEDLALDDEDRLPRFEKPLREVRVGESPSRPWGISVPVVPESTRSVPSSDHRAMGNSIALPADATSAPAQNTAPACSCGHGSTMRRPVTDERREEQPAVADLPAPSKAAAAPTPQVVFNGPVFFGYTPEQATAFLQSMNLGNMTR